MPFDLVWRGMLGAALAVKRSSTFVVSRAMSSLRLLISWCRDGATNLPIHTCWTAATASTLLRKPLPH